ncbi:hypothetical protein QJQ45_027323 [Haematococcus lacustris]|nr:hypothetical protein QJQ45_027323 [Haematococcus lacustris]
MVQLLTDALSKPTAQPIQPLQKPIAKIQSAASTSSLTLCHGICLNPHSVEAATLGASIAPTQIFNELVGLLKSPPSTARPRGSTSKTANTGELVAKDKGGDVTAVKTAQRVVKQLNTALQPETYRHGLVCNGASGSGQQEDEGQGQGEQEVIAERRQVIKAAFRGLVEAAQPDLSPEEVDAVVAQANQRMTMGSMKCCLAAVMSLTMLLQSFLGQPTPGFPAAGPAPCPPPPPDPACPPYSHPRLPTRCGPRGAAPPAQLPPPVQLDVEDPSLLPQIKAAMDLLTNASVQEHLMRGPHHSRIRLLPGEVAVFEQPSSAWPVAKLQELDQVHLQGDNNSLNANATKIITSITEYYRHPQRFISWWAKAVGVVAGGFSKVAQKHFPQLVLAAGSSSSSPTAAAAAAHAVGLPHISKGIAETREYVFDPDTQIGVGIDPGVTLAVSAASGVWDKRSGQLVADQLARWKLTKGQVKHASGLNISRRDSERWLAPIKPHLQHLAAASSASTSLVANLRHITVTLATWDAVWEVYLDPKVSDWEVVCALCAWLQLEKDMAELSMKRHRHAKQLVVFFGAASIGTGEGWGADAVLRACCKVVYRPKGAGQRRGRVVLVDEHSITRVSSAVNGKQPCEKELDHEQPTRHADWKPPAGQVDLRLLRPAWSQQRDQPVRGLMWCPDPARPSPAKRSKRTEAEQAAEPSQPAKGESKGKGKAAKAKPAPQPGRWLDRDSNAVLNMQRIGESRWRPQELCWWAHQSALPAKGKE